MCIAIIQKSFTLENCVSILIEMEFYFERYRKFKIALTDFAGKRYKKLLRQEGWQTFKKKNPELADRIRGVLN